MFLRSVLLTCFLLITTLTVGAKEIVLTYPEAFYLIRNVQLSKNALWINITLTNNSSSNDWYIQVPPPVSEVDLYTAHKDGKFNHIILNDKLYYQNRPVKVNGFILPLKLGKGETRQYYLRVKNHYKLKIPVYAGTLEAIYEEEHFKNIVNGFMFGALLALMIYNLYIYIVIKDRSHLWYLGYVLSNLIFLLIWNGYFTQWLPAWSLRLLTGSSSAALLFSLWFSNGYLRIEINSPVLLRISKWLVIVFVIPIGVDLAGYSVLAFKLLQMTWVIAAAYWLFAGLHGLKKDFRPAAYYLAAVGCLLTSYGFYEGFHSGMSLQMGLCLQAIVLSFALAVKLNDLKKETVRLQVAMLEQTADFSKALIISQENEKESISNELNMRVGQQLVQLKNELFMLERQSKGAHPDLFNSITKDIGTTIEEVSNVSFSLRPYQIEVLGLRRSVERLVEDVTTDPEINVDLNIDEIDQLLNKEAEMNSYRIIQELLSNLIKHSAASTCSLSIKLAKKNLSISYHDNGKGYDAVNIRSGLGLSGIRERSKLLNAELTMSSIPKGGTRVYIKIPIHINSIII
ncbi:sensor histidine kinase [Pedobacter ginsengisoli]|uniref:sensor histidine kinase n=1 Tax=Pedobacter ginsengisoli TaxID=363852 RepID=UPI00254F7038|nr:7TM diverse intracellular signaling domain-containing protein [Pedobacter ginsengisoli]